MPHSDNIDRTTERKNRAIKGFRTFRRIVETVLILGLVLLTLALIMNAIR